MRGKPSGSFHLPPGLQLGESEPSFIRFRRDSVSHSEPPTSGSRLADISHSYLGTPPSSPPSDLPVGESKVLTGRLSPERNWALVGGQWLWAQVDASRAAKEPFLPGYSRRAPTGSTGRATAWRSWLYLHVHSHTHENQAGLET